VQIECVLGLQAQLELLKHSGQLLTVNELDRRCSISNGLLSSIGGEGSGRDDDALVSTAGHRTPKIANVARSDRARVLLALKQYLKTDQRIDLQDANAVDAAISGPTGDGDFLKS